MLAPEIASPVPKEKICVFTGTCFWFVAASVDVRGEIVTSMSDSLVQIVHHPTLVVLSRPQAARQVGLEDLGLSLCGQLRPPDDGPEAQLGQPLGALAAIGWGAAL